MEQLMKIKEDKSGYTMEAGIPWASLGNYRPKQGDKILLTAFGGGLSWGSSLLTYEV